jgi:alkanesulfonate monooxygenase SsuD/methylene tetrahydromethanopterin reductase-like flavin-dependent oxidoreductase (luciferase family)
MTSQTAAVTSPRFGLLLPHFGRGAEMESVLHAAREAERYGFSSVWVRDRLLAAAPHGLLLEAGSTRFFEPILTLAAVAAATRTVHLGTAVLTPVRHPVKLLQDVGTLWAMSGGRLELGVGLGVAAEDLGAIGSAGTDRKELFARQMQVLTAGLDGAPPASAQAIDGPADIDPRPESPVPIWYGGTSVAAVRRAFRYGQGWIAGRLPIDTFRDRMGLVQQLRGDLDKPMRVATMPITVLGESRSAARARVADAVTELAASAEGSAGWRRPASGSFRTIEDLTGLLIAGDPQDCIEQVQGLLAIGIDEIIFDFRVMFDDIFDGVRLLGEAVIPHLSGIKAGAVAS